MSARSGFRGKPTRRSQKRPLKTTLLIVCEGRKTEFNYFDGLKRNEPVARRFSVTVKRGAGGSRLPIVQRAIDFSKDQLRDYDETWCVMDVERLQDESARSDLLNAIEHARANGVHLCLSNPSVEVWFLAHFRRTSTNYNDGDAVIAELNKHWNQSFQCDYSKTDDRVYDRLEDRTHSAIQNAKNVLAHDHGDCGAVEKCNSSTEVYKLVERLFQ